MGEKLSELLQLHVDLNDARVDFEMASKSYENLVMSRRASQGELGEAWAAVDRCYIKHCHALSRLRVAAGVSDEK